ncbi:hypothetical protein [Chondromyces crocatus]|uniref:Uncharacterized protein n=1 Tax=Chondromyces crocatus TaxID=52 RepID=A0A0K1ENW9_CHOCO|nr:hypothetical protein [Chondromyces crocatus]AKT42519.1 uncharacterized protein CMC5_067450 [Chondromyces crocatus]
MARATNAASQQSVMSVVRWYFDEGRVEGVPFYCDATRIGAFAVEPNELTEGTDAGLFRLFVALAMYQALRDVVIMRQQRSLPRASMRVVADVATVKRSISRHACPTFASVEAFEGGCDVAKNGDDIDCGTCPGAACHVKDATRAFNRMGDMGKLPTSAWLRIWRGGGVKALLDAVRREEQSPTKRAVLLVERFAAVHRVGRKLATMFVSALSTPALAPGLTPWFPEIDGNELVVVDTNVARAVDALCAPGGVKTYDARERWVLEQASRLDLRAFGSDLPAYSPRLLQEALYAFCSKSNRVARGDACAGRGAPCAACAPTLCPFALVVATSRAQHVGEQSTS